MPEEWRPVVGSPNYEVSNLGNVRNALRGNILKPSVDGRGYLTVRVGCTRAVHRLVAEAFLGPCPKGQQTRHMDGNSANPHLTNLQYGTRSENRMDAYRHGTCSTEKDLSAGQKARDTKDMRYGRRLWANAQRAGIAYSKAF